MVILRFHASLHCTPMRAEPHNMDLCRKLDGFAISTIRWTAERKIFVASPIPLEQRAQIASV